MSQVYVDLGIAAAQCRAFRDLGALSGGPRGSSGREGWGKRVCLMTTSKRQKFEETCCMHRYANGDKVCCQCGVPFEAKQKSLRELVILLQFKLLNDELGI